jgi:hypothetical protein
VISRGMVLESFNVSLFSTTSVSDGVEANDDDDTVDDVLVSGNSDPSSEEDEAPPPNRPFSLPRAQKKVNQCPGRVEPRDSGRNIPVRESSLTSAKACASFTVTKPESERATVAFTTGSIAPRSVRLANASVTPLIWASNMSTGNPLNIMNLAGCK